MDIQELNDWINSNIREAEKAMEDEFDPREIGYLLGIVSVLEELSWKVNGDE